MIQSRLSRRLLAGLFIRQQNNQTLDFLELCACVRARPYAVLKALRALGEAGLVNPSRLRLTLGGLAVASALVRPAARAAERARELGRAPGLARCAA